MNKNCVISAVGKDSLHRMWTEGGHNFDLHLIVYDDSTEKYLGDTEYICHIKGYKLKNVYKYLGTNSWILNKYDYFFIPDDDIMMDSVTIDALFDAMQHYRLKIAQPSLVKSYYSWDHTLKDRFCFLRYTNMIEMMVPCFSRDALQKVLFTFNENETGWGIEAHWPLLIDSNYRDMAIIDGVSIVHTRPIQSGQPFHYEERAAYLKKYNLSATAHEYGRIPADDEKELLCDRDIFLRHKKELEHWLKNERPSFSSIGIDGCFGYAYLLALLAGITQSQKYTDIALKLVCHAQDGLGAVKDDMNFQHGITGCCWLIEFLAQNGFIDDNPEEVLEDIDQHIRRYIEQHKKDMSFTELTGIGRYYLARLQGRNTEKNQKECEEAATLLSDKTEGDSTLPNPVCMADALSLLWRCGMKDEGMLRELERQAWSVPCSPIEHAYRSFRIYMLTEDEHFKVKVREELKNLPPRIMTLESALMLAEILFHTIK